jgi:hypothetical protein
MPVEVEGLEGFRKALKALAPNIAKEMNNQIKAQLSPIVQDARAKVPAFVFGPPNNWSNNPGSGFPEYNPSLIRAGLVYSMAGQKKTKGGFKSMISLLNKNAAGAIIETAGRTNQYGRPTSHMVSIGRYGRTMRIKTTKDSQSNNPDAGNMMINRLDAHVGELKNYKASNPETRGRLLYAAYAENQGKAVAAIMNAINKAREDFNRQSVLYDYKKVA